MRLLIVIMLLAMTSGCDQKEMERFGIKHGLKFAMSQGCEGNETCEASIDNNFDKCLTDDRIDALILHEKQDDEAEMNKVILEVYDCIMES